MTLSFYFDEQVSRAIADGLLRRGIDVLTAQDDGHDSAADERILDRAAELDRVLFTQDRDFLIEAARRQAAGVEFVGIIYAHPTGPSIGQCVRDMEMIASVYDRVELANRVEYLPL